MTQDVHLRQSQASNTYSTQVGELRVTVLLDSVLEFPLDLVTGAPDADLHDQHAQSLRGGPHSTCTINSYLVETDSAKVLIDTGVGGQVGTHKARLTAELRNVGVEPTDITHVLFTHLHSDHAGGAITPTGESVFAGAEHIGHRAERDYWFGNGRPSGGAGVLEQYKFTQTLRPILSQFSWVRDGSILPGIDLVHLPGHTPGHSGFRIQSAGESVVLGAAGTSLFIWGDIVHQPHLQFANPNWGVAFDSDPAQAIKTRTRVLEEASEGGYLIAGLHIDFPAIGRVRKRGKGGYEFVPTVWHPAIAPQ